MAAKPNKIQLRTEGGLHSRNTEDLVQIGGKEEENRKGRKERSERSSN
jgi:hypothetical protein